MQNVLFFYIDFFFNQGELFFLYTCRILSIEIRVDEMLDTAQTDEVELMISHYCVRFSRLLTIVTRSALLAMAPLAPFFPRGKKSLPMGWRRM